jgi:hypothetical protein
METETQNSITTTEAPPEIKYVPLFVKGIVIAGLILFAIRIPTFNRSLQDAIIKNQAKSAYESGRYEYAVKLYEKIQPQYPEDLNLIKMLAFSYHRANQPIAALQVLSNMEGKRMPKHEVNEINSVIESITLKLKKEIK